MGRGAVNTRAPQSLSVPAPLIPGAGELTIDRFSQQPIYCFCLPPSCRGPCLLCGPTASVRVAVATQSTDHVRARVICSLFALCSHLADTPAPAPNPAPPSFHPFTTLLCHHSRCYPLAQSAFPGDMKTAEDKILFKNHFFKLGQGRLMLKDDVRYWLVFWSWPTAALHVFDLLTPYDIQTVRDRNLPNFLTMVHVLSSALVSGQSRPQFQNSARMLCKILPFLFEMPDYERIERRLFLEDAFDPMLFAINHSSTARPLGTPPRPCTSSPAALAPALIQALVKALLESCDADVWEAGLGRPGPYAAPDIAHDVFRADTLRLLVVLTSRQFYEPAGVVKRDGNVFLTLLVSSVAPESTKRLACGLTNIMCRTSRLSRGDSGLEGLLGSTLVLRYSYALMCAQLLASSVLYAVPPHHLALLPTQSSCNMISDFYAQLCTTQDLSFIASHLLAIFRAPLEAENSSQGSSAPGMPHSPSPLSVSAIVILRVLYQNNKVFQELVAARLAVKLAPCVLYHIYAFYDLPEHEHSVKLASCFLVELSGKDYLNKQLLLPVPELFMEQFPPEFRVAGPVSTRDFAIIHVCQILLTLAPPPQTVSKYTALPIRQFLLSRLTELLHNVIPCTSPQIPGTDHAHHKLANINPGGGISYRASTCVTSVVSAFSTREFLVANVSHAQLLALLLRALCSAVTKYPLLARMLLVTFLQNEAMYNKVWTTVQDLSKCYFSHSTLCEVGDETAGDARDEEDQDRVGVSEEGSPKPEHPFKEENALDSSEDLAPSDRDALAPVPPAGMSEQRRQKWPQETPISETWGGTGLLRVILIMFIPFLKQQLGELWSNRVDKTADDLYAVGQAIGQCGLPDKVARDKQYLHYDMWPETPSYLLVLSWNSESLGWLTAVVAWDVYVGADTIRSYVAGDKTIFGNISSSLALFSKFASGWTGFGAGGGADAASAQEDTVAFSTNVWAGTNIRLFSAKAQEKRLFGLRIGSAGSAGSVNELTSSFARKFRLGSRSSSSSTVSTIEEMQDLSKLGKRDSVSSLHSLNTLNRARSYTPRSSISNC